MTLPTTIQAEIEEKIPGNFPWRDDGKNLLLAFDILIQQNGGRERLLREVERELRQFTPRFTQYSFRYWSDAEMKFLIKNYPIHSSYYIGQCLGRTLDSVSRKVDRLIQSGLLKRKQSF